MAEYEANTPEVRETDISDTSPVAQNNTGPYYEKESRGHQKTRKDKRERRDKVDDVGRTNYTNNLTISPGSSNGKANCLSRCYATNSNDYKRIM